jgi:hypothetical protein
MCTTPVLNKLLAIQLRIQKKVEGIVFDNDAKGCYNRIISGIAMVCLKRISYSSNSVCMLGLLWVHLEHHIATGYGVSDKTYSSTLDNFCRGFDKGVCITNFMGTTESTAIVSSRREVQMHSNGSSRWRGGTCMYWQLFCR